MVLYELVAYRWRGKYDESYSGMGKLCGGRRNNSLSVQGRIFTSSYADSANVRRYGIKMFKFDFAYFDAATPDAKCTMLPADIEEQNKNAFISAIKEFRYKNPDVLFYWLQWFRGRYGKYGYSVSKNGRPTLAGNI